MSETLQSIIRAMVHRWLDEGVIVQESNAWAEMEKRSGGKISRTTAREIGTGKKTAVREDTFQALHELTGADIPALVAASKRWRPPVDGKYKELRRLQRRVAELERELEEVKAQAAALPSVVEIAQEKLGRRNLLEDLRQQGDEESAEIVADLSTPRNRKAR